jgi:hypothetical protein
MATCYIRQRDTGAGRRFDVKYRVGGRYTPVEHAGTFRTKEEAEIRRAVIARHLAAGIQPRIGQDTGTTWVYFIQSGDNGPIKIGVAGDVGRRLRSMQTGNPETLRLLGKWWATVEDERTLHRQFAYAHLHGEWFKPVDELVRLASSLGGNA